MKTYQLIISFKVEEEKTSHFVQLDDGTFAEMVEGHEMVAPGRNYFPESRCSGDCNCHQVIKCWLRTRMVKRWWW